MPGNGSVLCEAGNKGRDMEMKAYIAIFGNGKRYRLSAWTKGEAISIANSIRGNGMLCNVIPA